MRTLSQILDSAQGGETPTHDECLWALLMMASLATFDHMELSRLVRLTDDGKIALATDAAVRAPLYYEEAFKRRKRAYAADPKVYLGDEYDPQNPAYQSRRKSAIALFDRINKDKETP